MAQHKQNPILAIHGSASSGSQWRRLIQEFEGERIVLAPDLPGYGKNTGSPDLAAPERFDWLSDIIKSLGGKFDLVGHSFGGAIAMRLAEQHRDQISNVVLYEPVMPHEGGAGVGALKSLWSKMELASVDEAMDLFCSFWSGNGTWAAMSEPAQARLIEAYETILLDFEQAFGGQVCLPIQAYTGALTILRGDTSPEVARHMSETLAALYPQAEIVQLHGLGHFAPVVEPDRVNAAIRACLGCAKNARNASLMQQSEAFAARGELVPSFAQEWRTGEDSNSRPRDS